MEHLDNLKFSIARIESGGERGTGFVIDGEVHVLTCAHVLSNPEQIQVVLANATGAFKLSFEAKQIFRLDRGEGDIALIKLDTALPNHIAPLRIIPSQYSKGNPFETFGFPDHSAINGFPIQGKILDTRALDDFNRPRIVLDQANAVTYGVSGGPIFDIKLGGVIGMITDVPQPDGLGSGENIAVGVATEFIDGQLTQISLDSIEQAVRARKVIDQISDQKNDLQDLKPKITQNDSLRPLYESRLKGLEQNFEQLSDIISTLEGNLNLLNPITQLMERKQAEFIIASKESDLERLKQKIEEIRSKLKT